MMQRVSEFDLNNLLLPLSDKVGANQKISNLIEEMNHPNVDWKYIVSGLRSYLYDYVYEIPPFTTKILPIVFYFLGEATLRKKNSAIRACDTFIDRFIFVINNITDDTKDNKHFKNQYFKFSKDYIHLLIEVSKEGFYFEYINNKITQLANSIINSPYNNKEIISLLAQFISLQYEIYVENTVSILDDDVKFLNSIFSNTNVINELMELVDNISDKKIELNKNIISERIKNNPEKLFKNDDNILDFSLNSRNWEKVCLIVKNSVIDDIITDETSILSILEYLIKKSQMGSDNDLQLLISRTAASVCSHLVQNKKFDIIKGVIDLVIPVLQEEILKRGNYFTSFSTIYNIGKTVVESEKTHLIDYFIDKIISERFCFPEFSGIASDWSIIVNSSHLENIRTWMKLIELNPPLMRKLAASLIVNLKLGGVFLKDTDVFQRDISQLLNSDNKNVFYIIISLAAVFPAFYHDIGATGDIRHFTEKIDTNHEMNDLIHFLRKQVHVESSSRTVFLFQKVMEFYITGDKELLLGLIPDEVYENLENYLKLINLESDKNARTIFEKARANFPEIDKSEFWDFLNEIDRDSFNDFVEKTSFDGIGDTAKKETLFLFNRYFQTKNPTELDKILKYYLNKYKIQSAEELVVKVLYEISDEEFRNTFKPPEQFNISSINVSKFIDFLHVYRMLYDKYNFSDVRAIEKLELYAQENLFSPPQGFFDKIRGENLIVALSELLSLQETLKNEILLSRETFEPVDTIEFKRHIAFGIPSMFGSYKEKKFDTLKVFFHINLIRFSLFEKIIEQHEIISGNNINFEIMRMIIVLFFKTFLIDGLSNQEMVIYINLLDTPNMRVSQFKDITNHLLVIHGEISDTFNEIFKNVCRIAINNIGVDSIAEKFVPNELENDIEIIIDRFLRDQIMQSPLLQLFDNFLIRLKESLNDHLYTHGDIICLNKSDTKGKRNNIFDIKSSPDVRWDSKTFAPIWEIGAKAHGLFFVKNIENMNVPDGFVFSAELSKRVKEHNINNPRFLRKISYYLKKYIDQFSNNRFGNSKNPMLVSVRSGAVFSMPGVLDTITNVGITQEILDYYAEKDQWFAYDCYRRLIQDFAISHYGMDRSIFENLMNEAKESAGVQLKEKLTGKQMELLTRRYRYAINDHGFSIPKDPYDQLLYAIIGVYNSWDSKIARNYRDFVNISGEWKTAVIVQKMVFGNFFPSYITGVVTSLNLSTEYISLLGEYKTRAQGHDIVSGVARVFPISEEQKKTYTRFKDYPSLELQFPHIYKKLYDAVLFIREKWGNDIEVEFTVEDDKLYILQIRGMTKHLFEIEELEESPDILSRYLLGQGLAASGGAISGRVVFDINKIDYIKERSKGDKVILVRPETNPEDVIGLKKSDGILTCLGGMTSHAVLQMRRLEKSGVSDFSIMKIDEKQNQGIIKKENDNNIIFIREGDFITIDGSTGHVYLGFHRTRKKSI